MTPIQQAIANLKKRIELSGSHTYDEITKEHIHILESLLPKEKEFALHCYREGIKVTDQSDFMDSHIIRNQYRHEFINQLYPEK